MGGPLGLHGDVSTDVAIASELKAWQLLVRQLGAIKPNCLGILSTGGLALRSRRKGLLKRYGSITFP
ncbi:hypothetical protein D8674_039597 [Pyrus ussuriensis x Pyrus communis]|uniref:Uncharacterized protein n=1 Tax=Pyrus ussuriensis x Pyrus communis TaxID=2448454 RepID=A0A5N5FMM6_9ROSA|nr:hypothetical protein D8674_039597 [Pyrus ussuriensis x Pyrus communis]